jgi:hypothetical protein
VTANATKVHDNRSVMEFLAPLPPTLREGLAERPWLDDILTGAVSLKSPGQKSTRPLKASLVYLLVGLSDVISVEAVHEMTGGRYSNQQASRYAAAARVVSKAIAGRMRDHGLARPGADFNFSPIERTQGGSLRAAEVPA